MSAQHRHPRVGAWSSIVSLSLTDMFQVVNSEPRKYQDGTLHAREKQVSLFRFVASHSNFDPIFI
jgi:hypothetical protein